MLQPFVCRTSRTFLLTALGAVLLLHGALAETGHKTTQLADGVYAIEHDVSVGGNTTVIIGDRQVLVFDTSYLPSAAREDIEQIRSWTDKPVTFVVNSHFHNDHNYGNRVYMDAFPALTIIAEAETKRDMDRFGPTSAERVQRSVDKLQQMLNSGKGPGGTALTEDDSREVKSAIEARERELKDLRGTGFQSATLTFEHSFTIDLGHKEVRVLFLGRGNTSGDAVVFLPKEKILVTGDLVVYPVPFIYDGYPSEWIQTLQNLTALDAATIVPGHGPVLRDKAHLLLIRELLVTAEGQMDERLRSIGPALSHTLEEVKVGIDLTLFRSRFAGNDKNVQAEFDDMVEHLTKIMYYEAAQR